MKFFDYVALDEKDSKSVRRRVTYPLHRRLVQFAQGHGMRLDSPTDQAMVDIAKWNNQHPSEPLTFKHIASFYSADQGYTQGCSIHTPEDLASFIRTYLEDNGKRSMSVLLDQEGGHEGFILSALRGKDPLELGQEFIKTMIGLLPK